MRKGPSGQLVLGVTGKINRTNIQTNGGTLCGNEHLDNWYQELHVRHNHANTCTCRYEIVCEGSGNKQTYV